jgi:hypothetical protein
MFCIKWFGLSRVAKYWLDVRYGTACWGLYPRPYHLSIVLAELLIILINNLHIYIFIIHYTIPRNYPFYLNIYWHVPYSCKKCVDISTKRTNQQDEASRSCEEGEIKIDVIVCDSSTIWIIPAGGFGNKLLLLLLYYYLCMYWLCYWYYFCLWCVPAWFTSARNLGLWIYSQILASQVGQVKPSQQHGKPSEASPAMWLRGNMEQSTFRKKPG